MRIVLESVALQAPVIPKKFLRTSGNFSDHENELKVVNWSQPTHKGVIFFQSVDAIVGSDQPVIYPEHLTKKLDYGFEVVAVIGKAGESVTREAARPSISRASLGVAISRFSSPMMRTMRSTSSTLVASRPRS